MGQRGRDSREHKAPDPEYDEDGDGQAQTIVARSNECSNTDDQHGTEEVGVDEDLTSAPLVEEDTREGADEGVGQEEHREGPRHGRRRGLAFR